MSDPVKVIIISSIDIAEAVISVQQVIDGGLVSNGKYGEQYCYVTAWDSGVKVYADKTKNGTHTFKVWRDK